MNRKELIKKYIEFFESKGHKEIPRASLIPLNDPTVLFTTAGMQPLVPYLLGQKHPLGKRVVNVQRCIRTGDIEEVGDETHHTFFEMLGNWSLGDYWKEDSIKYSFDFLTKKLKIPKEKINVTCFKGEKNILKDNESSKIWKDLGINKIKFLGKKDNWWGPAGTTGPCGPDTEIFVNNVEIWNNVFMEYNKTSKGKFEPLKQKNVDTGMGVERTVAVLNGYEDNYLTNSFKLIIKEIEKLSNKNYKGNEREMRIIADHIKASVFIIADGIIPGNSEQSYVLRRLIRRAVRYGKIIGIKNFTTQIAEPVFKIFDDYPELKKHKKTILKELKKEEDKFLVTLEKGLNKFKKFTSNKKQLSGKESFLLYQSFGFPIEMIEEECKKQKIKFSVNDFEKANKEHQKLSRTATAGRFKSGLADNSELTTKLHTAAHLLLEGLKQTLGKNITQKGSNINAERLRFDFSFPRKLEEKEVKKIEYLVNSEIKKEHKITVQEMSPQEAKKSGAAGSFDKKYGNKVSVYSIGNFSKEICAGPHVKNTKELGTFKIKKQESVGAGTRRIKATLE